MIDERTEQLINRKLDGELTAEESLELDKRLIRDPEARAMIEEYARLDERAGQVLRAVVAAPAVRVEAREVSTWTAGRRWWQSFGLVSGVAAAVTFAVLVSQRAMVQDPGGRMNPAPAGQSLSAVPETGAAPEYFWQVEGPRRETLNLDRQVFGVWDDETQSLYLLEADSMRSSVEPVKFNY